MPVDELHRIRAAFGGAGDVEILCAGIRQPFRHLEDARNPQPHQRLVYLAFDRRLRILALAA